MVPFYPDGYTTGTNVNFHKKKTACKLQRKGASFSKAKNVTKIAISESNTNQSFTNQSP